MASCSTAPRASPAACATQALQRGDRVAIRLANGADWVLAFFGCQLLGAVVVPVNTRFTDDEVAYVLEDSGAAFTFTPGAALPDGEPTFVDDLAPDDLAAIFYTSGTTGFPKGAMTTHANFTTNNENCLRVLDTPRSELAGLSTLVSVPLFHVTGCNSQLLPMLEWGGRIEILSGPLDLDGFFAAVGEHGVNQLVSVPAIYHAVIRHPEVPRARRQRRSLGLLRRRADRREPRAAHQGCLPQCARRQRLRPHRDVLAEHRSCRTRRPPSTPTRSASPCPSSTWRSTRRIADSRVGELLVRGANVVQGYWNKPEATAETFVDGWLHTGDLARIDADGLLYIVDRKKDMINRGGENVYCIEVENALAGAPGVGEAAAVGVPDEMMGEKVGAAIVPAPGATLDVAAVIAHCRERLADFKVPQYVAVLAEPLPRNPGGKVLKAQLRDETDWGKPLR